MRFNSNSPKYRAPPDVEFVVDRVNNCEMGFNGGPFNNQGSPKYRAPPQTDFVSETVQKSNNNNIEKPNVYLLFPKL